MLAALPAAGLAQPTARPAASPAGAATVQQAMALAQKGRCGEALPALRSAVPRVADKQLRYRAAMAEARCAMSLDDVPTAVAALTLIQRDFPHDPEMLYLAAHFYSSLANRTAQLLVSTAPTSFQVQKLNAEALESQGKGAEAAGLYRKILEQDPKQPEIHYRLARIILDQPPSASTSAEARKELEQELAVNPGNAAAVFVLGELARREGKWEEAIERFKQAASLDAGFSEAYLALGMSLNSAGKHAEAVPPLERYVKMAAEDPAGHYQLAMAYTRTGNKDGAARELELQRKAAQKTPMNPH